VRGLSTELRDELQTGLGGAYVVERELGRGGMATVFLVRDTKHGRSVALKVLHPELAASLGPERFRREIGFVARLQHPHILSIHDSGETLDGHLWFTMPYVEGETLRARLQREGQLPVADALRIAREVAWALDYAHSRGVVHRDIKPENILLTETHALVSDFGIARAVAGSARETSLTESGLAVGTPHYMSPEQATAARQIDGRTDVYSLGAVLYEMLAGEPPFTGATAQTVLSKMLTGDAPSVRRVRPAVPEAIDTVIQTALARVPADRYPTAGAFAKELESAERTTAVSAAVSAATAAAVASESGARRAMTVGRGIPAAFATLVLGILLGGGVLFAWRRSTGRSEGGKTTLAVLPFESVGDSSDAYFADGVTDAVRDKLAALPGLEVIASGSTGQYRHSTQTLQQIGRQLGVRYLLVGKVRWATAAGATTPTRVEVRPELVEVETATDKWGQPFDAALTDVFQVQAEIAEQVASTLRVTLDTGEKESLASRPTKSLDAYDAYLRGWKTYTTGSTLADDQRAVADFEQAVALDSNFALAWAALARGRAGICLCGPPKPGDGDAAHRAALRALALQPTLPEAHVALGDYHYLVHRDYPRALAEYESGLRTAPNNALLISRVALVERHQGQFDSALVHLRRALQLDPENPQVSGALSLTYLVLHRWDDARALYQRRLVERPTALVPRFGLTFASLYQGDTAAARATLHGGPADIDSTAFYVNVGEYDVGWLLTPAEQRRFVVLTPSDFGDDRAEWAADLASMYRRMGDQTRSRAYADTAHAAYTVAIATAPDRAPLRINDAFALALLGRTDASVSEAQHAAALFPFPADAWDGAFYQEQVGRVYVLLDQPDRALDQLEPLLRVPYTLTPAELRIDPDFAPLKGNARFDRLVATP
jgi:TolB-like protein/Flp pilus assembly protein TadD